MFEIVSTAKNVAIGLSPWVPWDKDFGLNSITESDLTAAIAKDVAGARLIHFELDRNRGTTDRARLQLRWNAAGTQAGLPTKAFAKATPSRPASRWLTATLGPCATGVPFYNPVYPDLADIPLKPYYAKVAAGGRFLLVL